jgi:hypothetical protein
LICSLSGDSKKKHLHPFKGINLNKTGRWHAKVYVNLQSARHEYSTAKEKQQQSMTATPEHMAFRRMNHRDGKSGGLNMVVWMPSPA